MLRSGFRAQGSGVSALGFSPVGCRRQCTICTEPARVKWPWVARARGGYPAPGGSRLLRVDGFYRGTVYGLMVQDSWFNVKRVTGLEAYGAQGLGVWDQGSESQGLGVLGLGLRAKGFGGQVCLRV